MEEHKVVIIGAGPTGLSCGLNLIKQGVTDIVVVEKFEFPRNKCCAGYITNKTKEEYELLGLDIEKTKYSLIKDFNIIYNNDVKQTIANKFLYTNKGIDRVELDYNFFKLAKSKGMDIREKQAIRAIDTDANEITLTGGKIIKYERLVFADGTLGFGSGLQRVGKMSFNRTVIQFSRCVEEIFKKSLHLFELGEAKFSLLLKTFSKNFVFF